MNIKQQVVTTLLTALIATSAVRANGTSGPMPYQGFTPQYSAPAFSPSDMAWKNVMSGSIVPLTIKGRDLNASWRSFTVSEGNDLTRLMLGAYGFAGSNALYSRGDEISVTGETYLVAYRLKAAPLDLNSMSSPGYAEKMMQDMTLKADSTLQLSLLNVRMTSAFNQMQTFNPAVFNASSPLNSIFTKARQAAQNSSSSSNMKQVMFAILQYTQDYDEKDPPMQSMYVLKKAILPYVRNEEIFRQPSTKTFYVPNAALSKKPLAKIAEPSRTAAIYEAQPDSNGIRAVAFADGHVKRITPAEWTKIKKDSGIK